MAKFRPAPEQNGKLQVSQVGIPSMYLALGCMGKISSPVSVPRSSGERSNKTLIAEEGKAKVSLLSSKGTECTYLPDRHTYLMFQNVSDIFGKTEG